MPPSWNLPGSLNLKVISSSFESLWHSLYTPLKLLDTSYNFIPRPCLIHHFPSPSSQGFSCGSAGKESTCNAGDLGSIPELGKSPGEGNSYPLRYSGLESVILDCTVHGVTKSRTQMSDFHFFPVLYLLLFGVLPTISTQGQSCLRWREYPFVQGHASFTGGHLLSDVEGWRPSTLVQIRSALRIVPTSELLEGWAEGSL